MYLGMDEGRSLEGRQATNVSPLRGNGHVLSCRLPAVRHLLHMTSSHALGLVAVRWRYWACSSVSCSLSRPCDVGEPLRVDCEAGALGRLWRGTRELQT